MCTVHDVQSMHSAPSKDIQVLCMWAQHTRQITIPVGQKGKIITHIHDTVCFEMGVHMCKGDAWEG